MLNLFINRHPLFFGILYLSLIPIYALIYTNLYRSFYHSTVKFEPRLISEKIKLMNEFQNNFTYNIDCDTVITNNNYYLIKSLKCLDLWISNGECNFNYKVDVIDRKTNKQKVFGFTIRVYLFLGTTVTRAGDKQLYTLKIGTLFNDINFIELTENFDFLNCLNFYLYESEILNRWNNHGYRNLFELNYNKPWNINEFFNSNFSNDSVDFSTGINIVISEELEFNLISFYNSLMGFPYLERNSNFIRMIYFSAITITTVGYGDIVPITNTARILVTSESLLGIVIIGLFLNSLAARINKNFNKSELRS